MDPNNHKQLLKYINKNICRIIDDYTVIESIADGCDSEGELYWVECKNGWHDRSWLLNDAIKKQKMNIYDKLKTGYKYKGTTYYFDLEKLMKLIMTTNSVR